MERKRTKRVSRTGVLLVAVSTALVLAAGASAREAARVFTDPANDAGGGPDIRAVTIGDSGGIVTFRFVLAGMKVTDGSGVKGTAFFADLDTNRDGHPDYRLAVGGDATGVGWELMDPRGKQVPQSPTMSFFSSGDAYTFKLASTDLGGATSFDLWAASGTVDENGAAAKTDDAPDGGVWSYSLTTVKPLIGMPTTSPIAPVAGKAFTITLPVTRSDSGARLTIGTMTSDLRVGSLSLAHTQTFKNGTAALHLIVPASAKGEVMTVRVAIVSEGRSVTRLTTFHVA